MTVAATAGLGVVAPEVLHLGNHTTVRLRPWPIVARIASGTSFDLGDGSVERELAVGRHLAAREAPAVRPTKHPPPGPYFEGDCAVTLWELVEGQPVATQSDELMAAASLRSIHSALADIDADLPSFITKVESCETILADPVQAPELAAGDRHFLHQLYAKLRPELDGARGPLRPLHGDTHMGNVLIAGSRAIWMDLEAACLGPLEWDVVNLPAATWPQFGELDPSLMRLFSDVRGLCVAVWCWAEFDRSPATQDAAIYQLGQLKSRFG